MTVTNYTTNAQSLRQLAENRLETAISQAADLREEISAIEGQLEDLEAGVRFRSLTREGKEWLPFGGLYISGEASNILPEIEQIAGAAEELLRQSRLLEFEAAAAEQLSKCSEPEICLELNRTETDYEDETNREILFKDWAKTPASRIGKVEAVRKWFNYDSPALWRHSKDCNR